MHKTALALTVVMGLFCFAEMSSARKLRDLIPSLYGGDGIFLADPPAGSPFPTHAPHFTVDSAAAINRLNDQIAAEIGVFPFSSSVAGFTFAFDPTLGTFQRTTETLGPLFAERAQTLGRRKLNFHVSFTTFEYDEFNGQDLDNLQVLAPHQPDVLPPDDERTSFELDTVRLDVDLDIRVWILAFAATYGITDRLDVGIFVPIVHVDMDVRSRAEVVASPDNPFPAVHTFTGGPESPDDAVSGSAIGLGDIVVRAKYRLLENDAIDLAGALLLKFATGDENDFLGTGDTTVRPVLVVSRTFSGFLLSGVNFTPHLNLGFEFNANRAHQHAVEYVAGFDVGTSRLVLAGEFIGSHEPDGDGIGDTMLTASVGVKWNPWKRLLLSANAQFPLNDDGLRSNLIMTFGLEYGI